MCTSQVSPKRELFALLLCKRNITSLFQYFMEKDGGKNNLTEQRTLPVLMTKKQFGAINALQANMYG